MSDKAVDQTVRAEDDDHARVIAVSLMTCTHREGRGHRFSYLPGIGVKTTSTGRTCLRTRRVI